jgi:elongation factor 1-beta
MAATIKNLASLNSHLVTRSYIAGYSPSADDASVFERLGSDALQASSSAPHAYRWALHISALQGSVLKPAASSKVAVSSPVKAKAAPAAAESDEFENMFAEPIVASVYEEEDGETEEERAANKARRERMAKAAALKAEADAKKGAKAKVKEAEKSLVVLEVKPWEADTDLEMVWREIIKFEKEGLSWGQSFKLEPVAYGIKKLVMTCSIVDALIVMDDITEAIEALEDYVQSVNVASMNKI